MTKMTIEVKKEGLERLGIVAGHALVWLIWEIAFESTRTGAVTDPPYVLVALLSMVCAISTCIIIVGIFLACKWVYEGFVE